MKKKWKWASPSNIAIVKYWGKWGMQYPMNPSLSFTLQHCLTETSLELEESGNGKIEFKYEGRENPAFSKRVIQFIDTLGWDFLADLDLNIDSRNTFPHSAGIASSASAMSALSLCLLDLKNYVLNHRIDHCEFLTEASRLSRLASGSACRSVFPKAALWGKVSEIQYTSNDYAIDWSAEVHDTFKNLSDWIFIVSASEKSVSSSAGHALMPVHPYKDGRIQQAMLNTIELVEVLRTGNWTRFIEICENEALSLHALMMSSNPSFILLEPDSLRIIQGIRKFRKESGVPICFTIDAGPNIHVIFNKSNTEEFTNFLKDEFPDFLNPGKIIKDEIGDGPKKLMMQ